LIAVLCVLLPELVIVVTLIGGVVEQYPALLRPSSNLIKRTLSPRVRVKIFCVPQSV